MFYELNEDGYFVCDAPSVEGLTNWTAVELPQPCNNPWLKGKRLKTGEWVGVWKDDIEEVMAAELDAAIRRTERIWRNSELTRADVELNKVQDGDGVGTVSQWRTYRKELRAYPASENFPDQTFRPVAPDFTPDK